MPLSQGQYAQLRTRYVRRLTWMQTEQSTWDTVWDELAEFILPYRRRKFTSDTNRGQRRNSKIIDNTATLAARTLRSGMMSGLTSPTRAWFRLVLSEPDLMENEEARSWLAEVEKRIRVVFARSNLYKALPLLYGDLAVYGTGVMIIDEDDHDVIRTLTLPLGTYYLAANNHNEIDTLYRVFRWTVRQAMQEFGKENLSPHSQSLLRAKNYEAEIDILHAIEPNEFKDPAMPSSEHYPYASSYWELTYTSGTRGVASAAQAAGLYHKPLRVSGFVERPFVAPRWDVMGVDVYGTGPGVEALGDAKMLQLEQKRKLQALEKHVNPPMTAPTSLRNKGKSTVAGAVTYVDQFSGLNGFAPAYQVQPRLDHFQMEIEDVRARIRSAFYSDLFMMIAMDPRQTPATAREIEERSMEKLMQLGPILERLNDELIDPMIHRVYGIMMRNDMIPAPPPSLEGRDFTIEQISFLHQSQKMIETGRLQRLLEFVAQAAQLNPDAIDKLDIDYFVEQTNDLLGLDPKFTKPDEKVAAQRAQRAAQQQAMQAAEAMKAMAPAAGAAKQLSEADIDQEGTMLSEMLGQMGTARGEA